MIPINEEVFTGIQSIFHYWTMKGSKFLLSYELNQIIKNIFFFDTKKNQKLDSELPEKQDINQAENNEISSPLYNEKIVIQKFHQLERLQSNQHKTPITTVKFVISVDNPQINVNCQSKDSQMLINSKKDCLIVCYEKHLPFDKFHMDVKSYLHLYFSDMEGFTAPTNIDINNQIFWLNDNDSLKDPHGRDKKEDPHGRDKKDAKLIGDEYELREGMLNRIAKCSVLSITITYFKLLECEIDFSKSHLEKIAKSEKRFYWDEEPRMRNVRISGGKIISFMDSKSYYNFRNVMDLLGTMVSSDARMKEIEKENKELFAELKKFSKQAVLGNIQEKISEIGMNVARYRSNFEYSIDFGEFSMIKGETPFMKIKIEKFKGNQLFYEDESSTYQLIIHKLDLKNLLDANDKEYGNILTNIEGSKEGSKNNLSELEEAPMITLKMHYGVVNGLVNLNKWKVYEQYEVKIVPLVIRMTEEIYNAYYEYVFASQEPDKNAEKTNAGHLTKKKVENSAEKIKEAKKKVENESFKVFF